MTNSIYGESSVAYAAGIKVQQTQTGAAKGPERRRIESTEAVRFVAKRPRAHEDEYVPDASLPEDPLKELNDLPPRSLLEFWKFATSSEPGNKSYDPGSSRYVDDTSSSDFEAKPRHFFDLQV